MSDGRFTGTECKSEPHRIMKMKQGQGSSKVSKTEYFGFSIIWVIWLMLYISPSIETSAQGVFFANSIFQMGNYINRGFLAMSLISALFFFRRIVSWSRKKSYYVLAALVFPVGFLFSFIGFNYQAALSEASMVFVFIGSAFEGIGFSLLLVPWVLNLCNKDTKEACLLISESLVVGSLAFFIIEFAGSLISFLWLVAFFSLSFLSMRSLSMSCGNGGVDSRLPLKREDRKPKSNEKASQRKSIFSYSGNGYFIVAGAACGIIYGFVQSITYEIAWEDAALVRGASLAALLFVSACVFTVIRRDSERNLIILYKGALPIMIIGLLLLPLCKDSYSFLPTVVTFAGYIWFTVCVLLIIVSLGKRVGSMFAYLFMGIFISENIGNIVGNYLSSIAFAYIGTDIFLLYESVLVVVSILVLVVGFLLEKEIMDSLLLVGKVGDQQISQDRMQLLSRVAENYRLTEREQEVFMLLANGARADEISEQLVISLSTVRTHIHKIYEKMGVHSYKEVSKLIKKYKE